MQPPMQELVVQDLHDNTWTFRHIYRGEDTDICLYFGTITLVGFELLIWLVLQKNVLVFSFSSPSSC